ncbi:COG4315 family predicted lipoprotein [Streptomyces sp. CA-253872]|uniref:COG4315 family predicted lipoprotein n=1 Tax=Streptomyces sp. CA-253872 TaxID=3240067 RepID=UPI003D8AC083
MSRRLRAASLLASALAVAAFATACSSDDGGGSGARAAASASAPDSDTDTGSGSGSGSGAMDDPYAAPSTSSAGADASGSPDSAAGAGIGTSRTAGLGTVIADAKGRTVYVYDPDKGVKNGSACYGECASTWPPVPATTEAKGVDRGLLGSVTRKDGTRQLTVKGKPVYLFAGDAAAGDTKGQNLMNVWHVVSPEGAVVTTKPTS